MASTDSITAIPWYFTTMDPSLPPQQVCNPTLYFPIEYRPPEPPPLLHHSNSSFTCVDTPPIYIYSCPYQQPTPPNIPQLITSTSTMLQSPSTSISCFSPDVVRNVIESKLFDEFPERKTASLDEKMSGDVVIGASALGANDDGIGESASIDALDFSFPQCPDKFIETTDRILLSMEEIKQLLLELYPSSKRGEVITTHKADTTQGEDDKHGDAMICDTNVVEEDVKVVVNEENTVGYEPWNREWDWDDESVEIEMEVEDDSELVLGGKVSFRDSGDVCDEGEENWDTSEGCELWDRSWDWDSEMEEGGEVTEKGEVDKFEEAVEEHSYEMEEAVNVETADNGVEKEADRDELTPSGIDSVVDNGKDVVKEVPDLVTASVGVSEYGSGDSKDSTVVNEGSEIGFPYSSNQEEDQSVILEPSDNGIISKQEPQLYRDIKKVDVNEEGEGALSHISEKKNDISGKNDKDLKMSEIYETSAHRQYDINEDLNNVPDGSKCDEKADMVEDLVDIVSDDGIDVKSSGVALQNWQNGVSFSKVLNLNGFAGVEHDSQLQETSSSGDSEVDLLRGTNSGATATSSVSSISIPESHSLTLNSPVSSLLADSFLTLRCEVVAANIVKSGSSTFTVYFISVTDVENKSWSIKRRFQHFEELHRRLKEYPEYTFHLPPKHFLSTGLDVPVIRERCKLLDVYLKKLLKLPTISGSIEVWDFISVDSQPYSFSDSLSIIETLSGTSNEKKKILARMYELGMTPVLPAFSGNFPAALKSVFSAAKIEHLGNWFTVGSDPRWCCTYLLNATEPLFIEIGKAFIWQQLREYGRSGHIYNCDTFDVFINFNLLHTINEITMTFTTAAASEMRDRIGAVAGKEVAKELMVSTFHSFALQLCRAQAEKLERTPEFLLYGQGQQRRSIIEAIRLCEKDKNSKDSELCKLGEESNGINSAHFFKDKAQKWLKFVTQAKASGKNLQDFQKSGDEIGAAVFQNYNNILKSCDALDYHDLISCSVKLLTDFPFPYGKKYEMLKAGCASVDNFYGIELLAAATWYFTAITIIFDPGGYGCYQVLVLHAILEDKNSLRGMVCNK